MWFYIFGHVEFEDKQVLDLGCGYGDLLSLSLDAGALYVMGVDMDFAMASYAEAKLYENGYTTDDYSIVVDDIDRIVEYDDTKYMGYDIIICTSVLPYLKNPDASLKWMRENSEIAIIECQYADDGPGPEGIRNDKEMSSVLGDAGWKNVNKIGTTDVVIRPSARTIWKCYD
jgi:SAM-dependent methyltransferase